MPDESGQDLLVRMLRPHNRHCMYLKFMMIDTDGAAVSGHEELEIAKLIQEGLAPVFSRQSMNDYRARQLSWGGLPDVIDR